MAPLLVGLLAGLAKSKMIDEPKQQQEAILAAQTQALSPWTQLQAAPVTQADPFGSALQGAMTGYSMDQNMEKQGQQQSMLDAQMDIQRQQAETQKAESDARLEMQRQMMQQWSRGK